MSASLPPAPCLPRQYRDALRLSEAMLRAATAGDWDEVRRLRHALPGLARDLEAAWDKQLATCPDAMQLLERARLRLIRQILQVDEKIRRLSSPGYARLSPWLETVPMQRVIVEPSHSSIALS